MKTGKWTRILGAALTAAMLVGSAIPLAAADDIYTQKAPDAVVVETPENTQVKREYIPADVDSIRGAGGWEDDVYYIPEGSTVKFSLNPAFDGYIHCITLIDCTLLQEAMENDEPWWYDGRSLDFFQQSEKYKLPVTQLTCGTVSNSAGDTMQFGQPGHLYSLKLGTESSVGTADYYHIAYFKVASNQTPATTATANPTSAKVLVNGEAIAFDAYEINNNNYFKLRDIAKVLSGSEKQFEVTWDGAKNTISLISGQPYTAVGGELTAGSGTSQQAKLNTSAVILDGETVSLTAYTINGNNYFKLRDLGAAFDFGIGWDGAANTVTIDTSTGYTPE